MAKSAVKAAMHRAFADAGLVEVECPEWPDENGKPVKVKFKARMTVDDFHQFTQARQPVRRVHMQADGVTVDYVEEQPLPHPGIVMFKLMAVNDDLTPLVDPNDDDWFENTVPGDEVAAVADRAKLYEAISRHNPDIGIGEEQSEGSVSAEK